MTETKFIIKTGFALAEAIRRYLSGEIDGPEQYYIVEAVVEEIAKSAGLIAATRDDLKDDE